MSTEAEVLLIIVSATLSIFLLALIVALVYVIFILRQLRRISERAENVADSVESAAEAFRRTASPLALLKLVSNIVDNVTKMKRNKKG